MNIKGAVSYFSRSAVPQPDGRQYEQRVREAVNTVASRITSYRELAAALINARDGSILEITEAISVPQTILIKKNRIRIFCSGRGALLPVKSDMTLFLVVDANDTTLNNLKVLRNEEGEMFKQFIEFSWVSNKKNIYVTDNYVESLNFMNSSFTLPNVAPPVTLDTATLDVLVGQRTYISGNTHRNYQPAPRINTYRFISGFPQMCTISCNETESSVEIFGVGNIISNNGIFGLTSGATTTSVYIPSTERNIVAGNLVANNGSPVVFINNTSAGNQEIAP